MKNRISEQYSQSTITTTDKTLYIADFTERTCSVRKVEIKDSCPVTPDGLQDMDCLVLDNPVPVSVEYSIFGDHQFKDEEENDVEHCECCLFPSEVDDRIWMLFIEIKDCKPKNIVAYKEKVKRQLISTVSEFRKYELLTNGNRVYGIISFPRRSKTSFNDFILGDVVEQKRLYEKYKILFVATNHLKIENTYIVNAII